MEATTLQPRDIITAEVADLIADYLAARAEAEVLRAEVDKIGCAVLDYVKLYDDLHETGARITDPRRTHLSEDDAAIALYFAECDSRQREAGLKPIAMPEDQCPALSAEWTLTQIENRLIDASGRPFNVDHLRILEQRDGLAKRQKWVDLIVGMGLALEKEEAR